MSAETEIKETENGTRSDARQRAVLTEVGISSGDAPETAPLPSGAGEPPVTPPTVVHAVSGPEEHGEGPTTLYPIGVLGAEAAAEAGETPKPERRVGMVGYTSSRDEAPYDDPAWELWGMNNLHLSAGFPTDKYARWYNLHDLSKLDLPADKGGDPAHLAWLREEHPFPIFLMDPMEGVLETPDGEPMPSLAERTGYPAAVTFPKLQILSQFPRYFTNTVSWQIAHLMWEAMRDQSKLLMEIGLYGIDMAVGTEYSAQRPSVEYFLGLIQGAGVIVHLPETSDLLKAAELYGGEDQNSGMRAKVALRLKELREQGANIEQQLLQGQEMLAQVRGAIDSFSYMQGVWLPNPEGARDGQKAAAGSIGSVGQLLAELDVRDRAPKKE